MFEGEEEERAPLPLLIPPMWLKVLLLLFAAAAVVARRRGLVMWPVGEIARRSASLRRLRSALAASSVDIAADE